MRKALLVLLLILVVIIGGGDLLVGSIAEARLAEVAQQRLGLTERPAVDLQGFPFVYHALRRRFPAASIEGRDVRVRGLSVERFTLELRDVRFDSTAAVAGGGGTVRAREGSGKVEITQEALGAYLERRDVPFRVELLGSSRARVSGTASVLGIEVNASAVGTLAVAEGSLEFRPERVEVGDGIEVPASALAFRVDVPKVFPGLSYQSVTIEEGRAVLSFRLRRAVVPL
jgi:hypothetical protein